MGRISQRFKGLQKKGKTALIPFIVFGDPDIETTEALILSLIENGADLIELGVHSPDPFLDGHIIQSAHQRALKNCISLNGIFLWLERR